MKSAWGGLASSIAAIVMRLQFSLIVAILLALPATPSRAFTDAELIDGFERTVFGSEYQSFGWQSFLVKKFAEPVRVFVDDRSTANRGGEIADFIRSLPAEIAGLDIEVVAEAAEANYRVFVVDRSAYRDVVAGEVYARPTSSFTPGKCLVRVLSTSAGISRSDAVIVADEGEFLFRRCMVEEILQGLGPVNDDRSLNESVFNDMSRHSTFTDIDRHILNMLYHPAIEPGMTKLEARRVLPAVAAEVQARLK
jgi:hypothetical protein